MKRALVLLTMIFTVMISPMQSLQVNGGNAVVQDNREIAGMQRADVIVKKYRHYHSVMQYRRWNETQGYWVDPDWIDMG